jgi:tetratricopeptide (TPR) repeat protein
MRFGDAARLAQEEIKRSPNVWIAYKALGLAYFGLRRKEKAVAPLTVAFEKLPRNTQVCNALAQSLAWCSEYDKALYPALIYLNLTSTSESIDPKAKYLVSQIINNCSGQTITTIDKLATMVDMGAPNAVFHFSLADILDRTRHFAEAIKQYSFGLYLSPNYARGLFRLGLDLECYKKDYPAALGLLAQAHRLAPTDKQIAACYVRLKVRLANRYNDLAWTAKDWILKQANR